MSIPNRSGEPWTRVHIDMQNKNRPGRYLIISQRIRNVLTRASTVTNDPLPGGRASRSSPARPPAEANSGCRGPRPGPASRPCSATCPASTTMISSAVRTVSSRWATMTTVRPENSRSVATASRLSVAGSRRDDGSSRITTPGSCRNTRAKASSCCSPADRPCPSEPSSESRPIVLIQLPKPARSRMRMISASDMSPNRVRLSRTEARNS